MNTCLCCLETKIPLLRLNNCTYSTLLHNILNKYMIKLSTAVLCIPCHALLKKAAVFQRQVEDNCRILSQSLGLFNEEITNTKLFKLQIVNLETSNYKHQTEPESIEIKEEILATDTGETQCDADDLRSEEIFLLEPKGRSKRKKVKEKPKLFPRHVEDNNLVLDNDEITQTNPFNPQIVDINTTNYEHQTEEKGKIKEEREATDTEETLFDADDIKSEEIFLLEPESRKKRKKVEEKQDLIADDINLSFVESNIRRIDLNMKEVLSERLNEESNSNFIRMKYKCTSCLVGFDFEEIFQDHMEKKHNKENGEYICEICSTVFNKKSSYAIHYRRHYIRYDCLICGHRGIDKSAMERHIQGHDGAIQLDNITCEVCGFVAKSKRSFRYHKEKHNSYNKCGYCMKSYVNKNSLKYHILFVHKEDQKFSCEHCGKIYKRKSGLLMHKLTHVKSPAEAYCRLCDHQFKTIYIYQQHLKTSRKHITEDDKKYICECGLKFMRKQRLQDHIDWVHLKRNKHVCDICDKKFTRLRGLMKHKQFVHEKLRRPRDKICDHCGKGFTTNAILSQHIRTHTGERPLKCALCEATFAQSAALYTHTKLVHRQTRGQQTSLYVQTDT